MTDLFITTWLSSEDDDEIEERLYQRARRDASQHLAFDRPPPASAFRPGARANQLYQFFPASYSAAIFVAAALGIFFIGGVLTTVVPPIVDKSWAKPFENDDPGKGPTGKLQPYTEQQLRGRAIYVREGCWYCHTQQTRTLLADTKRSGWRGVDAPISTPDEFVYDSPHLFGTKRTGPDLSRVGGKYDEQWRRAHFRNPRDLVPGSIMPPYPWIAGDEQVFQDVVAYLQTLGRAKNWRPDNDYEK